MLLLAKLNTVEGAVFCGCSGNTVGSSGKSGAWPENGDAHISELPHYHWSCSTQLSVYVSPAGTKCEVRFQKRGISDHIYLIPGHKNIC